MLTFRPDGRRDAVGTALQGHGRRGDEGAPSGPDKFVGASSGGHPRGPTVSPGYVRLLLAFLQTRGVDPVALYGAYAVERYARAELGSRVPAREWEQLVIDAEAARGDEGLVLQLAEFVRPADAGPMGFLAMACPTLREAVEAAAVFFNVLSDAYFLRGGFEGQEVAFHLHPTGTKRFPKLEVCTLGLICHHARLLSRRMDLQFDADFCGDEPPSGELMNLYKRVFGGRLRFGQRYSGFTAPAEYGNLPIALINPGLAEALRREMQARQVALYQSSPLLVHRVERLLRDHLELCEVRMADVARELRMPARTLQTGLRRSGTSFREVVDRARHVRALALVSDPSVPLAQVAVMVGFERQSSFNHAFHRWTGKSPGEFRRERALAGTHWEDGQP